MNRDELREIETITDKRSMASFLDAAMIAVPKLCQEIRNAWAENEHLREENMRLREIIKSRIECHVDCVPWKKSDRCNERAWLIRECLDHAARIALAELDKE